MSKAFLVLLLVFFFIFGVKPSASSFDKMVRDPSDGKSVNGEKVIVHLIPHSHDDVGWLKTVDNYYYGGDMKTQFAGVQYTLDSVVKELSEHGQYKFSIVEMAFLYRWWNQATDKQKMQMKKLVANGQIEFLNAGWSMSDQANVYYQDFIDQMTVGLRWLRETFNYVPDVAWHIDPFGHQSSTATLFSQMGFQSIFFGRIDYQDKEVRLANKGLEMIWKPFQYSGDQNNYIFTHTLYDFYYPPPDFCFDVTCRDQPIKDDPNLQDYNIVQKSKTLADFFKSEALHYRTNNIMQTMGGDFQFTNALIVFKNIDKLINFINARPQYGITLKYSTPGDYIEAIRKQNMTYPLKSDDFFPYADSKHSFWTGFFTSRVALKGFVRDLSRFTQAVRKHLAELKIANTSSTVRDNARAIQQKIFGLETALGILQHHDAVAGTAKQKVTNDYVAIGLKAINSFNKFYKEVKAEEISTQIGEKITNQNIYINLFWNETSKITGAADLIFSNKTVLINIYNPGSSQSYPIKIKVPSHELNIVSAHEGNITGDIFCNNLQDSNDCELLFHLKIEQSSNAYVKLVPMKSGGSAKIKVIKQLTITQQIYQFKLGNSTNDSLKITRGSQKFDLVLNGTSQSFNINYNYYEGVQGFIVSSGAYIFLPQETKAKTYSTIKKIHYCDGSNYALVILEGDRTLTKILFSKVNNYVHTYGFEIQTFIDSIPVTDHISKEVTLNFKTTINNNKTFYTDSMGLEEQKRVINFRPSWNYSIQEPIAGNYYPVNSHIKIQDINTNNTLTILNDRSQGATVLNNGEIQIMIHRRCLKDDLKGVGEPLNETEPDGSGKGLKQYVRHYVVFNGQHRQLQKTNDQKLLISILPTSTNTFSKYIIRNAPFIINEEVKLYLRPFQDGNYLLRLHNTNPTSDKTFILPNGWQLTEHTLAANQLLTQWTKNQFKWNLDQNIDRKYKKSNEFRDLLEGRLGGKRKEKIFLSQMEVSMENEAIVKLLPFEMKAFKLSKV